MKIKSRFPPNIEKIVEKFGKLPRNVVFTYGNILYAPLLNVRQIPKDLLVHEKTHMKQQGNDPEGWWEQYLNDDVFRLRQELEAYKNQCRFFKQNCKIKSKIPEFLERIARDFSSEIYGNIISFDSALKEVS